MSEFIATATFVTAAGGRKRTFERGSPVPADVAELLGHLVEQSDPEPSDKVECEVCGRSFKPAGLPRHMATHD